MRNLFSAAIAGVLFVSQFCSAQEYPAKQVRIVVAFPPGGSTDVIARLIAAKLSEAWGQQVIVDNRPGAGTNIGAEMVARSPADGYTLLMCTFTCGINVSLYNKINYDPVRDFAGVSLVAVVPLIVAVHPSIPARSVKELIALAKAKPNALNYASFGSGSSAHLATEEFKRVAGVQMLHIPYKGDAPATVDLLGGHVDLMFASILTMMPHVKAGRVRGLGVTSSKRLPRYPEIPTVGESVPGFEVDPWFGIVTQTGTPRPIIDKLNREIVRAVKLPDVTEAIESQGGFVIGSNSERLDAYIKTEVAKWGKVIKAVGVKVD
jgi:tripartite-type tricarboxylate transporter receptor subunit TctC